MTLDSGNTWQSSSFLWGNDVALEGDKMIFTEGYYRGEMADTAFGSFGQWTQFSLWTWTSKTTDCDVRSDGAWAASTVGIQGIDFGFGHQDYGLLFTEGLPNTSMVAFPNTIGLNDVDIQGNDIYVSSIPYPGYDNHIMKSDDGGFTFGAQFINEPGGISVDRITEIKMVNDTIGYAVGHTGIYKTLNAGGAINGNNSNVHLGTDDAEKFGIKIYPNPTTNYVNIDASELRGKVNLQLWDRTGKLVLSESIENQTQISLSHLKSGIYLIRISANGNTYSQRVVKE